MRRLKREWRRFKRDCRTLASIPNLLRRKSGKLFAVLTVVLLLPIPVWAISWTWTTISNTNGAGITESGGLATITFGPNDGGIDLTAAFTGNTGNVGAKWGTAGGLDITKGTLTLNITSGSTFFTPTNGYVYNTGNYNNQFGSNTKALPASGTIVIGLNWSAGAKYSSSPYTVSLTQQ